MATLMEAVISLATGSTIKPPQPVNVSKVSEVESAFRFLQSGTNAGKTIIEIHEDDLVLATLLDELKDNGVNVAAPPCDISDEAAVVSVVTEYAKTFPPIRGCIQGFMVLRDSLFKHMTLENFEAALRPKV
ncbi:MAG: hypothetical protein Q9210_001723 [Variospora velana]